MSGVPLPQALPWLASTTRVSGSNNSSLFSHSSRGWKSRIKVSAGLVPPEASLLGS